MPSSVTRIQGNPYMWFIIIPLCIILAFCFFMLYLCVSEARYLHSNYGSWETDYVIGSIGAFIGLVVCFLLVRLCFKESRTTDISNIANYIETKSKGTKYLMIVKDNRFGLYNVKKRKVQIPCKYNYLSWKSRDNTLVATLDTNSKVTIDILGNLLK